MRTCSPGTPQRSQTDQGRKLVKTRYRGRTEPSPSFFFICLFCGRSLGASHQNMSQLHQGFITGFNRNKTIKFSLLRMAHPNIRIRSADRLNGNNPEIHKYKHSHRNSQTSGEDKADETLLSCGGKIPTLNRITYIERESNRNHWTRTAN